MWVWVSNGRCVSSSVHVKNRWWIDWTLLCRIIRCKELYIFFRSSVVAFGICHRNLIVEFGFTFERQRRRRRSHSRMRNSKRLIVSPRRHPKWTKKEKKGLGDAICRACAFLWYSLILCWQRLESVSVLLPFHLTFKISAINYYLCNFSLSADSIIVSHIFLQIV